MKNKYRMLSCQSWLIMLIWAIALTTQAQPTQPPVIQWQKVIEHDQVPTGEFYRTKTNLIKTSDGNYGLLTVAQTVSKVTPSGAVVWSVTGQSLSIYEFTGLAPTQDGGLVLLGRGTVSGTAGWRIIKLKADGSLDWTQLVEQYGAGDEFFRYRNNLLQTTDGGFLVAGWYYYRHGATQINPTVVATKYDTNGNYVWQSEIGRATESVVVLDVINSSDGGYVLTGGVSSVNTTVGWAAKLDREGNQVWQKTYPDRGYLEGIIPSPYVAGSYIAIGVKALNFQSAGSQQTTTLVIDADGNAGDSFVQSGRAAGVSGSLLVGVPAANGLAASHVLVDAADQHGGDFRLVDVTGSNQQVWAKMLGGSGADLPTAIVVSEDGGYLVAGTTTSIDGDVQGKVGTSLATWVVKLGKASSTNAFVLTQPTYDCSTGAITFNFTGGDGSPITYISPGIMRSSATSNTGTVEQGLRNDPKPITIYATQNGQTVSYTFDFKQYCYSSILPDLPDVTLVANQDAGRITISGVTVSTSGPKYNFTVTGLPAGVYLFSEKHGTDFVNYAWFLGGAPTTVGVYPVTITLIDLNTGNSTYSKSFKLTVVDKPVVNPPTGGTLTLTQPTYNCTTGAITFNFTGGDGSPITYISPGITRSSATSNTGTVEQGLRNDPKPITIYATQNGQTVSYTFDFKAYCGTPPTSSTLKLLAPTVTCDNYSANVTFNTSGGDGSSITYAVPGVTLSSPNSNTAHIFQCVDPDKPLLIQAMQSGYTANYSLVLREVCPYIGIPKGLVVKQIPDLILPAGALSIGKQLPIYDISNYFSDPTFGVIFKYERVARYSVSITGLPNGITYSTDGTTIGGVSAGLVVNFYGTAPVVPGVYTINITASNAYCDPVTTSFKIIVGDNPPTNGSMSLLAPSYNCSTGAITFNTTGGDGSPIEFQAAGITGWTTNPNQFVDKDSRTASDVKPFTLMARQSGQVVTYTWDLKAACGRARVGVAELSTDFSVQVLGNPAHEQVRVLIQGVEGQSVQLRLTDQSGRLLESRTVEQAGASEEQRFRLDQHRSGLLLLQATSNNQIRTVKIIKQ